MTTELTLDALKYAKGWQNQYRLLIQWGQTLCDDQSFREDELLVKGCESPAWLKHEIKNNHHFIYVDSDSRIVKGLGALLMVLVNNKESDAISPEAIKDTFKELGLGKHLSPSRANGFYALLQRADALIHHS